MVFITLLNTVIAIISFLAHGKYTSESALFDLPLKENGFVWVPFIYGVTLLLGIP